MTHKQKLSEMAGDFDAVFQSAEEFQPAPKKSREKKEWTEGLAGKFGIRTEISNVMSAQEGGWVKINKKGGGFATNKLRTVLKTTNGSKFDVSYCKNTGIVTVLGSKEVRKLGVSALAEMWGYRKAKKLKLGCVDTLDELEEEDKSDSDDDDPDSGSDSDELPPRLESAEAFHRLEGYSGDSSSTASDPNLRLTNAFGRYFQQNRESWFGNDGVMPTQLPLEVQSQIQGDVEIDDDRKSVDSEFARCIPSDTSDSESEHAGDGKQGEPEKEVEFTELDAHNELLNKMLSAGAFVQPFRPIETDGLIRSKSELRSTGAMKQKEKKSTTEPEKSNFQFPGFSAEMMKQFFEEQQTAYNKYVEKKKNEEAEIDSKGGADGNTEQKSSTTKNDPSGGAASNEGHKEGDHYVPHRRHSEYGSSAGDVPGHPFRPRAFSQGEAHFRSAAAATQTPRDLSVLLNRSHAPKKYVYLNDDDGDASAAADTGSRGEKQGNNSAPASDNNVLLKQILQLMKDQEKTRESPSNPPSNVMAAHPELQEFLSAGARAEEEDFLDKLFERQYTRSFCDEARTDTAFSSLRDILEGDIGLCRSRSKKESEILKTSDLPALRAKTFTKSYAEFLNSVSGRVAASHLSGRDIAVAIWEELISRSNSADPDAAYLQAAQVGHEFAHLPIMSRIDKWESEMSADGEEDASCEAKALAAEHVEIFNLKLATKSTLRLLETTVRRAVKKRLAVRQAALKDKTPIGYSGLETFIGRSPELYSKYQEIFNQVEDEVGARVKRSGGRILLRYSVLYATFDKLRSGGKTCELSVTKGNRRTPVVPFHEGGCSDEVDDQFQTERSAADKGTGNATGEGDGGRNSSADRDRSTPTKKTDIPAGGPNQTPADFNSSLMELLSKFSAGNASLDQEDDEKGGGNNAQNNKSQKRRERKLKDKLEEQARMGNADAADNSAADQLALSKLGDNPADTALKTLYTQKSGRIYDWNLLKKDPLTQFTISAEIDCYGWARRCLFRRNPRDKIFGPQPDLEPVCALKILGLCPNINCHFSHPGGLPAEVGENFLRKTGVSKDKLKEEQEEKFDKLLDSDKKWAQYMVELGYPGACERVERNIVLTPDSWTPYLKAELYLPGTGRIKNLKLGDLFPKELSSK